MWTILGNREQTCDRHSRRSFLQVGTLAGAGITLPRLLESRAAAKAAGERTEPRSAILVYLAGGASHYETFDPKPGAPQEIRGPYGPIATSVPGLQICETLPQLAKIAHQFSLIRSVCHENSGHGGGQRHVQTGYRSASPEFELPHDYPVVGSYVAKVRGAMNRGLPTFIRVPDANDGGAEFLGNAYDPFRVYSTGKPVGLEVHPALKLARMEDRRYLRERLDSLARRGDAKKTMDAMDAMERNALEMLSSTSAHAAFDLGKENKATRERYGQHNAGNSLLLARRFVEAGAGLVSVRIGSWDHHGNAGGTVKSGAEENCPPLDQALSALITDLAERGMTDDVLVYCWGEFGRTPRINNSAGRDHWPQAMSVLLSGGGLKAGRVVGATTAKGEQPADRALTPEDVLATVYRQLGIDPRQQFLNNSGRPVSILARGKAIAELI